MTRADHPVEIAALVPAAGRSERMGCPKLTLPVGGVPVIARVVDALRRGGASPVVVVVPPPDVQGASYLAAEAVARGARVVVAPATTTDMRASVELGLDDLDKAPTPRSILLVPGDSPGLTPEIVAGVIRRSRSDREAIVVATYGGRRGHPVLIPWALATAIRRLPLGVGVNALLAKHAASVIECDVGDPGALADLDTPEDYRRWSEKGPTRAFPGRADEE